jgi:flagellar motor switch protein FliG
MESNKLDITKLTGPQKAAIFLLAMGEELATSFFQGLDEKSIQSVVEHMSDINYVSSDIINKVKNEFLTNTNSDMGLALSGKDFLKEVVNKTMEKETEKEVVTVKEDESNTPPFSDLANLPTDKLFSIIKGEYPQTIALILSFMPPKKSAQILNLFPQGDRSDIALRIVTIGQVQDEIVREVDEAMKSAISRIGIATRKFDGLETLANILNELEEDAEDEILSRIEHEDSNLADSIRQKMFIFEDLLQLDERSFREILQNVDKQKLAKALKTASEELKKKIFNNLSKRAAEMLKEDMEVIGLVRLKEVEEAQQNILQLTKRLGSEGKIALIGKRSGDVFV